MSRRADKAIAEADRLSAGRVSRAALRAQQEERALRASTLAAERAAVAEVEALTADLPKGPDGTILGPDGRPLFRPVVKDFTRMSVEEGDDPIRLYASDMLMRAARMQRDGASLPQIAEALNIEQIVPLHMLDQALIRVGHPMLDAAIARGEEPEESKVVIGYETVAEADAEEPTAQDLKATVPISADPGRATGLDADNWSEE